MLCKKCLFFVPSEGKCGVSAAPEDDGTCASFSESGKQGEAETKNITTNKSTHEKMMMVKKRYLAGDTYQEIARVLGFKSRGNIDYYLKKLRETGNLTPGQEEARGKFVNQKQASLKTKLAESPEPVPVKSQSKSSDKLDEIADQIKESDEVTVEPKYSYKDDDNNGLDESDLQFIRDLAYGADNLVIHRKNFTATIEFKHREE